jgi:hypothetical protein
MEKCHHIEIDCWVLLIGAEPSQVSATQSATHYYGYGKRELQQWNYHKQHETR